MANVTLQPTISFTLQYMSTILSAGIRVDLREPPDVLENVGTIEVCADIFSPGVDCTVDLDFDLRLRTVNNSAGNIHVY